MKIVLIGAGSFVFGKTVVNDAIVKNKIENLELCLVDLNLEMAELMAAVAKRVAGDVGLECKIIATANREEVLPEADYVILCAAPQGIKRWYMDFDILTTAGLNDQSRLCGGLGGLSDSLRSITMAMDICRDMEKLCPDALLLNATNPLPRVVTAINRFSKIKAFGFCNIAYNGPDNYLELGQLLKRPADELAVVTAGLNHFAWLITVKDKNTGQNLMPELIDTITTTNTRNCNLYSDWFHEYGSIAMGDIDHHAEYLAYNPKFNYPTEPPFHGNADERQIFINELQKIADGELAWNEILSVGSWEHPVDFACALAKSESTYFPIINLSNNGYLTQLPDDRIVEVSATISDNILTGMEEIEFPEYLADLINSISDVHELIAEGAVNGDVNKLRQAIDIDPAITEKKISCRVLDQMLDAHKDMLTTFSA